MVQIRVGERVRGVARSYRGRYSRRARELATYLDAHAGAQEVEVRPWEFRLPRLVIMAAARSRGLSPVGGVEAQRERGPWLVPMRFARAGAVG